MEDVLDKLDDTVRMGAGKGHRMMARIGRQASVTYAFTLCGEELAALQSSISHLAHRTYPRNSRIVMGTEATSVSSKTGLIRRNLVPAAAAAAVVATGRHGPAHTHSGRTQCVQHE